MQQDLFRSGHNLALMPNFQHDILRSNYSSFSASRQEEHDADKINIVPLLRQKLLPKNVFEKTTVLEFLLSGDQTVELRSILKTL